MIKHLALSGLEKTINQLLSWDCHIEHKMQALNHKIIRIDFSDFDQHFYMLFHQQHILLQRHCQGSADLSICGTLSAFAAMSKSNQHLPSDIHVSGSAQLAQQFQQFFTDIDLDWEEQLAKLVGDGLATNIGAGLRQLQQSIAYGLKNFQLNTSEYLQQEIQLLPTKDRLESYYQDIDALRHRLARFEARLTQYERRKSPAEKDKMT